VACWWWTRARRPQIDPDSLDAPFVPRALRALAGLGWRPALFDLTHDLGVPVVAAVGWPQGGAGPMLLGFGAHPSAAVAAARAVTEVLQALPADPPARIGGDPRQGLGLLPGCRMEEATAEADLGFLIPDPEPALHPAPVVAVPATAAEALAGLVGGLTARGFDLWHLDQSRPDVPLPVTRILVPGLRHFRPRFAPGRLDEVPLRLGWAVTPGRNRLFIRQ
jgi:ribosomal protein S12 methylthiotransferase accessory factor